MAEAWRPPRPPRVDPRAARRTPVPARRTHGRPVVGCGRARAARAVMARAGCGPAGGRPRRARVRRVGRAAPTRAGVRGLNSIRKVSNRVFSSRTLELRPPPHDASSTRHAGRDARARAGRTTYRSRVPAISRRSRPHARPIDGIERPRDVTRGRVRYTDMQRSGARGGAGTAEGDRVKPSDPR